MRDPLGELERSHAASLWNRLSRRIAAGQRRAGALSGPELQIMAPERGLSRKPIFT